MRSLLSVLAVFFITATTFSFAQTPHIVFTSPAQNELNVPVSADISVTFDIDMDETTINDSTFVVNARSTGLHEGTITYDSLSKTATLAPIEDSDEGEVVTVVLTVDIQSSLGIPLDSNYVWSFTIALNNGDGTFAPHSDYPVADEPWSVFAADLDGDGDLDLITANQYSDNVSVLLNNGDGTFASHSDYPVGEGPTSVFAAELDGDGDLDLTTANILSDNVSVLLNNGDGTFAPHSIYPAGDLTMPVSVFAADLDSDGDLDLTTGNYNSYDVSVLLNNGDGTFAPYSLYSVGDLPLSVFAADLDSDADLDLITANCYSDNVSVLLNNGDGTFAPHSVYPVGDGPWSVFAADLDGEGDLDLATSNEFSNDVSVLLNNGDGTFAPHSVYPVGEEPYSIFVADFDGDGDLDLATGNKGPDNVSVLLNQGIPDQPPVLAWTGEPGYEADGISPDEGNPTTLFEYRIKYTDLNNDPPAVGFPKVHIEANGDTVSGSPFSMNPVNPTDTLYTDGNIYFYVMQLPPDSYQYSISAIDTTGLVAGGDTVLMDGPVVYEAFIRGDADGNGALSINDGLQCFRCQFVPGWPDSCKCDDATDADDNGAISIGDCLRILRKQFVPGWQDSIPPPCCTAPADCGVDPTDDGLGCEEHPCMGGVAAEAKRMR